MLLAIVTLMLLAPIGHQHGRRRHLNLAHLHVCAHPRSMLNSLQVSQTYLATCIPHFAQGLLSMVNAGPDSNTSHFSILMVPAPHLDGKYVVFGEVVSGIEVALKINALARGQPGGAAGLEADAIIFDAGEIKR